AILPSGGTSVHRPLLRRLAWRHSRPASGAFRDAAGGGARCVPRHLGGPLRLGLGGLRGLFASSVHGPFCTEIGRFWLRLPTEPVESADSSTLAVIAVTYAWWANPWHHLHWWIPALWYFKVALNLEADDVDIGLVVPHQDAEWGKGAAEPPEWSYLQASWPRKALPRRQHWQPGGLHADVLGWLSARPPRPLGELRGQSYGTIVLGL
ncbi:unnamed protein product, partial [Prorocentrum cordatum]